MVPSRFHLAFVRDCEELCYDVPCSACLPLRAGGLERFLAAEGVTGEPAAALVVDSLTDGRCSLATGGGLAEHESSWPGEESVVHLASEPPADWIAALRTGRGWHAEMDLGGLDALLVQASRDHAWSLFGWSGDSDVTSRAFVTQSEATLDRFLAVLGSHPNEARDSRRYGSRESRVPHPELIRVRRDIDGLAGIATAALFGQIHALREDTVLALLVALAADTHGVLGRLDGSCDRRAIDRLSPAWRQGPGRIWSCDRPLASFVPGDARNRWPFDAMASGVSEPEDLVELMARLGADAPPLTLLDWAHERFEWLLLPDLGFHEHGRLLVSCREPARLRAVIAAAAGGRAELPLLAVF